MAEEASLPDAVRELAATSANVKNAAQALKELKIREKALKAVVQKLMAGQELDVVNVRSGEKFRRQKRKSKGGLTKDVIRKVLMDYLDDNEDEVNRLMEKMEESRTVKEREILSITRPKQAS